METVADILPSAPLAKISTVKCFRVRLKEEMGVEAGHCYHCHTGRCPVGVATQDPQLRKRLDPDAAARLFVAMFHGFVLQMLWDSSTPHRQMLKVFDHLVRALSTPAT